MSLKCNLSPDEIAQVKTSFSAYEELVSRKKELAEEEKAIKADVANVIDGKIGDAGKLLKAMLLQYQNGENDLDEVGAVLDCIRNNGSGN